MSPVASSQSGSSEGSSRRLDELPAGNRPLVVSVASEKQATVISSQGPLPSSHGPLAADGPLKLLPGVRLGPFEVIECVGGGGMGRVFRALDTGLDRVVALKVLSPEQAADGETLLRFRNEARSAARLNHENIIKVYHVGEDRGLPYIAFEFIEGVHLRALVEQKGPLSLAEALTYTFQVAEALAHATARSIVHRDIKPSNVLITPEGQAKLIDMGLARLQHLGEANDLTASGVTLGTFDYISPEQARDPRTADARSDIYSLGCTFFFMLTGQPPFPAGTVLQKLLQHQGDEPPEVRQFRPELPDEVSRVVRRMMAKDPRHRYQDPNKLMQALGLLADQVGLQPAGPGQTVWVAPARSQPTLMERHLPWAAPVVALILLVGVLHFVWTTTAQFNLDTPAAWWTPEEPLRPEGVIGPEDPPKPAATPLPAMAPSPPESAGTAAGNEAGSLAIPPAPAIPLNLAAKTPAPVPVATVGESAAASPQPAVERPSDTKLEKISAGANAKTDASALPTPSPRAGVLRVDGKGQAPGVYPSLGAACAAAANNGVIELAYNGRQIEQPIALANVRLTVRPAEGFQPVLAFQPSEIDPVLSPRNMIGMVGSRLTLIDMPIELDIPRGVSAENWTLFDLSQGEGVALERCTLTIRNASDQQTAYHQDVAFFRLREPPAAATLDPLSAGLPRRSEVSLLDCVVRGEAVVLRGEGRQPVELRWDNGFLATTERLLASEAGDSAPLSTPLFQVNLKHVTAVTRRGLALFNHTQFTPAATGAEITCVDSVLVGGSGSPLLEQVGNLPADELRQRISWSGSRNFYAGFGSYWTLHFFNPEMSAETMMLDEWQTHWGSSESNVSTTIAWRQLPAASRPVHTWSPTDYALSETPSTGSPHKAASDRRDSGMDATRLPAVPAPALPSTAPPETP